jgi:cysteine-rich repeat protein
MLSRISIACLTLAACGEGHRRPVNAATDGGAGGQQASNPGGGEVAAGPSGAGSGGDGAGAPHAATAGMGGGDDGSSGAAGAGDAPISKYCGDAIRDPMLEECDDGPEDTDDTCSSACKLQNFELGVEPGTPATRSLGFGRHPLALGRDGAALAFSERSAASTRLRLLRFNAWGQPLDDALAISEGFRPADTANPVVAALDDGAYAVAWGDLSGASLDVELRVVSAAGELGQAVRVNASDAGAQSDPDLLWLDPELVVAWTDGLSVKVRSFSAALEPLGAEQTLSSSAFASSVALTSLADGWAAGFRELAADGENIVVRLDDGATFRVGPLLPGAKDERPALSALDETHLLLVFTTGTVVNTKQVTRLQAVVLDVDDPEQIAPFDVTPDLAPYATDESLAQARPSLARDGTRIFLSWQSESPTGDPQSEELFLRELSWEADSVALSGSPERSLLLDHGTSGAQQAPTLSAATLRTGTALATAFEDAALAGEDGGLVFAFLPTPLLKLTDQTAENMP